MGRVYLAKDTLLENEVVALKVLHGDLSRDEKHSKRFLREVQLARKVSHPNIVRTFDAGTVGGQLYFTMEYAPGQSLKERLQFGALGAAEVCRILIEILGGLGAIHSCGIIHRDLKPANVILGENGSVKIADFGIARNGVSDLTGHNELVGSIAYLAPELWKGREVSNSADLYALGIMAYEMLTGELPFEAEVAATMMCKHLEDKPVPPAERVPGVPGWLNALILKLLEKDPAKRPQSAGELKKLIDSALKTDAATPERDRDTKQVNPIIITGSSGSPVSKAPAPVRSIKIISASEEAPQFAASSANRVKIGVVRQRSVLKQTNSSAFASQTIQSVAQAAPRRSFRAIRRGAIGVSVAAVLSAIVLGPGWKLASWAEQHTAGLSPNLFLVSHILIAAVYLSALSLPIVLAATAFRTTLATGFSTGARFALGLNLILCVWFGTHAAKAGLVILPQAYAITPLGVISGIRKSVQAAFDSCLLLAPFGSSGLSPEFEAGLIFVAAIFFAVLSLGVATRKKSSWSRSLIATGGIGGAVVLQNILLNSAISYLSPALISFKPLALWDGGPFTIVTSSAQLTVGFCAWILLTGLLVRRPNVARR
ncbi:MAG: serine/threonine protein kinase [Oligoflexia bacterium]|nr:serine/threonine protein kinase [Oligoflexia bacterium]